MVFSLTSTSKNIYPCIILSNNYKITLITNSCGFKKNAVDFQIQKCYIIEKEQPPTKWLASLRYVKNKPTSIRLRLQGRFIYFRLLFLSIQASNAIRKLPPKNNRLKISYVYSICTTSHLFQVWEAHHLVTRLLLMPIIAYLRQIGRAHV